MSTFQEENPITERLSKLQTQWTSYVSEKHKIIRLLIEKEDSKMVEAFIRTEASEHGKLAEYFVNFSSIFTTKENYSKLLTESFAHRYYDEDVREEVGDALPQWNGTPYLEVSEANSAESFVDCLSSFAKAMGKNTVLILCITPHQYKPNKQFAHWLEETAKKLPASLKLLATDYLSSPVLDHIDESLCPITLEPKLNMSSATRELITAGDTNDPVVKVNLCLLNIMEAAGKKKKKDVERWGKEGIHAARQTGLRSLQASILMTHGSAHYQLKEFELAIKFFSEAEHTALAGIEDEDKDSCKAILLQAYNFQAATNQLLNNKEKAQFFYQKTADEAKAQDNGLMSLEASRMTAEMQKKRYESQEAMQTLRDAYDYGKKMDTDMQRFSSLLLICRALYDAVEGGDELLVKEIDTHAAALWGEEWLTSDPSEELLLQ